MALLGSQLVAGGGVEEHLVEHPAPGQGGGGDGGAPGGEYGADGTHGLPGVPHQEGDVRQLRDGGEEPHVLRQAGLVLEDGRVIKLIEVGAGRHPAG